MSFISNKSLFCLLRFATCLNSFDYSQTKNNKTQMIDTEPLTDNWNKQQRLIFLQEELSRTIDPTNKPPHLDMDNPRSLLVAEMLMKRTSSHPPFIYSENWADDVSINYCSLGIQSSSHPQTPTRTRLLWSSSPSETASTGQVCRPVGHQFPMTPGHSGPQKRPF